MYLVTFFISVYLLSNCSIICEIDNVNKLLTNFTSCFEILASDFKSSCNDTNKFIEKVIYFFVFPASGVFLKYRKILQRTRSPLVNLVMRVLFENCSSMPRKFYKTLLAILFFVNKLIFKRSQMCLLYIFNFFYHDQFFFNFHDDQFFINFCFTSKY